MTIPVSIIGSCVTRDAFTEDGPFRTVHYQARTSVLSIYSDPVPLDETVFPESTPAFVRRCIRTDFAKTVLADVAAAQPAIVVLDFIDERFNLFRNGDRFVSKSWDMYKAEVWRSICAAGFHDADKKSSELYAGTIEAVRRLYVDLAAIVGADNVYVHQAECAAGYWDAEGRPQDFDVATQASNDANNRLIRDMVAAAAGIIPATNVINVMDGARADARNRWNLTPFHYEETYYSRFLQALQARVSVPES